MYLAFWFLMSRESKMAFHVDTTFMIYLRWGYIFGLISWYAQMTISTKGTEV